MAEMRCVVAIPTRELFSGMIHYASVPSAEGYYGVLPGHEMIVASNQESGVLTLNLDEAGNDQRTFLLYKGASQVYNDVLTILGRFGVETDKIDVEDVRKKAEEMRKRVEDLENSEDKDSAEVQAELETSKTRLDWYQIQIDYVENNHAN